MSAERRQAAIEAGARALATVPWEMLSPFDRKFRLDEAAAVIDAAAPQLEAAALREAATEWQLRGWADYLPPAGANRPGLILGMAQRACDFLRARADAIERAGRR